MKQLFVDEPPKCIKALNFGVLSPKEVMRQSEVEISTRDLFDLEKGRIPKEHGALDRRMGVSNSSGTCETCHQRLALCQGHFGHIRLPLPVFHVGYFRNIIAVLQSICKECAAVLLPEEDRRQFLKDVRRPNLDNIRRLAILKRVNERCRKQRRCPLCNSMNGVVKKAGPLKIIHDKYRYAGTRDNVEKESFYSSFKSAINFVPELEKLQKKALDTLNPLRVYNLFARISSEDCELLGIDPDKNRPEDFLWQYMPAAPSCIRPSVQQDSASNEDDLTVKLTEIVWACSMIRADLQKGTPIVKLMEQWDYLQYSIAMYVNSDTPGNHAAQASKPIRGLCQRLKGKQGRFRGNLSGKRVDFSGRTVISPDPNLSIEQVAVPDRVAKILTYPERVTRYNIDKLKILVRNGPDIYPGANYIAKKSDQFKRNLRFGDRAQVAEQLEYGDLVERHIEDNDIVLFNRQPSLHRLSILSHYAKIRPWRTFRLNECVCTPYNADFDGDEMNLHVPQTEEARTEAINLMGVKNNLVTPRSGEPIIAATQDFITGSYLIAHKDTFLDRASFCQLCAMMCDGNMEIDIPPPAIVKPVSLWTGKQVFNVLIRPSKKSNVRINLEAKCKTFHPPAPGFLPDMSPNDGYVVIRDSNIMCGNMDKSLLGDGKKLSVFYVILRDYGPDAAIASMNRMAKMCARYMGQRGFSIGISDVMPGAHLKALKEELVEKAYKVCDDLISQYKLGKLETQPGCNEEQTLEAKIGGILSKVREEVGDVCIRELDHLNAPLIMATCGSKGSTLNVSQMVAVVGQQIISGSRVPDGFQNRSLPHFPKYSKEPPSKGFVRNSFFSGLTPTEFLFHAISGREGLVDTAVKTAETGYMSRRLMKSLEDISAQYDNTVRSSNNSIIQFQYGSDGLDPLYMEGDAKPVNYKRMWEHSNSITFSNDDKGLLPYQIIELADSIIKPLEAKLKRHDNLGKEISYENDSNAFVDVHEAQRVFYVSVREFIAQKAEYLSKIRRRYGLSDGMKPEEENNETNEGTEITERLSKISKAMLEEFLNICFKKYERSQIEPATAVGAIGAQSIGEPGTQMTLKTFHFAGVASMNVTLGVPRIKEIINASKVISTPIITASLVNDSDERAARVVKGRIEKTLLKDVIKYIEDVYMRETIYLAVKVDFKTILALQLELTIEDIARAIYTAPKLKIPITDVSIPSRDEIHVYISEVASTSKSSSTKTSLGNELFFRTQFLRRVLPNITVKGFSNISRAVINIKDNDKNELLVEGYGLKDVMATDGVIGTKASTNHILEMRQVLGIEAARASIVNEIDYTMTKHGMSVDPRHIQLLGDVMTSKGEVLGITRFGLAKMRDSVLQLASFEKTTDHLFDAAFYHKSDMIEGVSECIILGQSMRIGTGAFQLVRPLGIDHYRQLKSTLFEDLCDEYGV